MQKELKLIDRQLRSNGLSRIQDSTQKAQNSLFRALAMSVYYSHSYFGEVMREIRLTIIDNLNDKRLSAYPLIHQSNILKKYQNEPDLLLDYWRRPDLACFHNDNLVAASAAFAKTICIYTLDKEEYLNQTYISASKNLQQQKLRLAKVGKKYYAVLKSNTKQLIPYLREQLIEQILDNLLASKSYEQQSTEDKPREDKIHYPNYDEVVTGSNRRQHKKSLSDCGEASMQIAFDQPKQEYNEADRGTPELVRSSLPNRMDNNNCMENKILDFLDQQIFDGNNVKQGYCLQSSYNQSMPFYPNYPYSQYMMQEQSYPYVEQPVSPINNERYTGRLKFFDQAGNYGFIVIDSLNIDLFVHFDDLSKAGLSKETLLGLKNNYEMRFQFTYYEYEGKQHKKSKKAIDLQFLGE